MAGLLGDKRIREALRVLGNELRVNGTVEISIVGGAAGLLSHQLPAAYTTGDVDTLHFRPPAEVEEVLRAAAEVARKLSLPANWLNTDAGLFAQTLPDGWEQRRVASGRYGPLQVFAIGRLDLIATKFIAHRPVDREHLDLLKVTKAELKFVRGYLDSLVERIDVGRIEMARSYVEAWETR